MLFGRVLAHEVGHVLGFLHRNDKKDDGIDVGWCYARNVMATGPDVNHEYFDLLQVEAARKALIFQ